MVNMAIDTRPDLMTTSLYGYLKEIVVQQQVRPMTPTTDRPTAEHLTTG